MTGISEPECGKVFAVGKRSTILQSTGSGWVDIAPNIEDVNYSAIWSAGPDHFFVTGNNGVIVRYRNGVWTTWRLNSELNLEGIWGVAEDDVFAVGAGGVILHFDGVSWEMMNSGTTRSLSAVHGRGSGDVFAVGLGGTILHFDGVVWTTLDSGTQEALYGVWAGPQSETIVVGAKGTVLHSGSGTTGGGEWKAVAPYLTTYSLAAVTGNTAGEAFAVGYNGVVARYDGETWEPMPTDYSDPLNAIHIGPCGDIHAAGTWGLILKYDN